MTFKESRWESELLRLHHLLVISYSEEKIGGKKRMGGWGLIFEGHPISINWRGKGSIYYWALCPELLYLLLSESLWEANLPFIILLLISGAVLCKVLIYILGCWAEQNNWKDSEGESSKSKSVSRCSTLPTWNWFSKVNYVFPVLVDLFKSVMIIVFRGNTGVGRSFLWQYNS